MYGHVAKLAEAEKKGIEAAVAAVSDKLHEIARVVVNGRQTDIQQGLAEGSARRELIEETGLDPDSLTM